jgi:hypothetical protein
MHELQMVYFGCTWSVIKRLYLKKRVLFLPYLGFHWRDFPEMMYLTLLIHVLQTLCVCFQLVNI